MQPLPHFYRYQPLGHNQLNQFTDALLSRMNNPADQGYGLLIPEDAERSSLRIIGGLNFVCTQAFLIRFPQGPWVDWTVTERPELSLTLPQKGKEKDLIIYLLHSGYKGHHPAGIEQGIHLPDLELVTYPLAESLPQNLPGIPLARVVRNEEYGWSLAPNYFPALYAMGGSEASLDLLVRSRGFASGTLKASIEILRYLDQHQTTGGGLIDGVRLSRRLLNYCTDRAASVADWNNMTAPREVYHYFQKMALYWSQHLDPEQLADSPGAFLQELYRSAVRTSPGIKWEPDEFINTVRNMALNSFDHQDISASFKRVVDFLDMVLYAYRKLADDAGGRLSCVPQNTFAPIMAETPEIRPL